MSADINKGRSDIDNYIRKFRLNTQSGIKRQSGITAVDSITIDGSNYPRYINEFWTSRQRQASSIHEISYRACFKAQLPAFFINLLSDKNDFIYDPFSGRGTTIIEAALLGRKVISNDINPLSRILIEPRLDVPPLDKLEARLDKIVFKKNLKSGIDLSMFYHRDTLDELLSLRNYLIRQKKNGREDYIDRWIRMIATNRLTGHSSGFFSVYTLPPNQAVSPGSQTKINKQRNQKPDYRDIKKLILKKSRSLIRNLNTKQIDSLREISKTARHLNSDASKTKEIKSSSVQLTVTSPPFLNIVQYADDNWLRCWFNDINIKAVEKNITVAGSLDEWCNYIGGVFRELYRITKKSGWVAFEVGEIRSGRINLDEYVVPLGIKAGFNCFGIVINQQSFTKTSNIWGIKNNSKGTNSNRIVLFQK